MFEMSKLNIPVIAIIIGEGYSGGALALGVANKVYMLENAIYSILSPEGYSSILWKDSSKYKEAAEKMKLTAKELYEMKIIDKIIEEPIEINNKDFEKITENIKENIVKEIEQMKKMSRDELKENRYQKFRKISGYKEV